MRYLYTSEQAKAIDTHAIQVMGFPSLVLMEKAAMAVAAVIMEKEEHKKILCICGMGNNGGDAMAVARILRQAGYRSAICPIGNSEKMTPETQTQMKMAMNARVPIVKWEAIDAFDVIVDGLFGIGLSKPIQDVYAHVVNQINASGCRVYAVDVPSGIDGSSGKVLGVAIRADETVTFGVHKIGMILYPGCEYAGHITVADIGFPIDSVATITNPAYMYEAEDIFRLPVRPNHSHKGTFGKVLVIAGSDQMSGACYLSAKAAYTMGAGLVKVVTSPKNREIILSSLPEVLFSAYDEIEEGMEWADVILIGPGIGLGEEAKNMLDFVIDKSKKPTVIDGDGITLLGNRCLSSNFIITPHLKEMARITSSTVGFIQDNLLGMARDTANARGYIVVLKDSRTVVSDGEEIYLNVSGNNGMATGGSGDVLAGTIAGLLAGGMSEWEAAKLGVYIHGLAGDCMIKEKGHYGLMASDLMEGLCQITREEVLTDGGIQ